MNDLACSIAAIVVLIILMGCNEKIRLFALFSKQIGVFRNDRTKKFSIWDFICFIVFPICLALIIVFRLNFSIDLSLSETFTTVFSLAFTVLFGFATIIVGKLDSNNPIEKRVVGETFISIMSATMLSLLSVICSIIVPRINIIWCIRLMSVVVYSVSIMTVMLLLLVSKRTFLIYNYPKGNKTDKTV